ncbi:alpha/beta hydrolase [Streptomyces sp. NPDC007088]|uniref:alpha/beta hydrolase n=1 Tax=Streptomyces sp. NPDC007088 TaxID=3364773 RepID=UPI0036B4B8ED
MTEVPTWRPPAGIAPRGTLIVLPGRGEHPLVYERFGRRLAQDGYVVHALGTTPQDTADHVRHAASRAAGERATAPVVLVGSDTGALHALHAAAPHAGPFAVHGVVLAGAAPVNGPGTAGTDDWDAELDARTACPTHRARLSEDAGFRRGQLAAPVPDHLLTEDPRLGVPALVLHGEDDPVTPVKEARERAALLPGATLAVVRGGVHDVLNDASHRTAAAALVLWLEGVRADPDTARPLLTLIEA